MKTDINWVKAAQKVLAIAILLLPISFVSSAQALWGTTNSGGANGAGTIGHYNNSTGTWTVDYNFSYGDVIDGYFGAGIHPSTLTFANGKFYGTTTTGGVNGKGEIFEWDPVQKLYTKKFDFNYATGEFPMSPLIYLNGKFYGMTEGGGLLPGTQGGGVIFEWDPLTNIYVMKTLITVAGGSAPFGSLSYVNGKFYGMASNGGVNRVGIIFEWDPVTNVITKKFDFDVINGSYPHGSLTYGNGKFYGMSNSGGINNSGVMFEWDPLTNVFTKKINSCIGTILTFYEGKLYSMIYSGIYEWDPVSNIVTRKVSFDVNYGSFLDGAMTLAEGKFYGMTQTGGVNNFGFLFSWDPVTNEFVKKLDFNNASGGSPRTASLTERPKDSQTITFNQLPEKAYGEAPFNLTATASSGLPVTYKSSNLAVATVSGNTVTIVRPGITMITASQAGNELFRSAPDVAQSLTVYKYPDVFVLNPGNGATNQKVKLNIKSKQVTGASAYVIQLSPVPDFSRDVIMKSGGYIQLFDSLHYGTIYYARVKTDIDSHFGKVTHFTTVPADVYLINPADMATHSKVIGNFTVKEVTGATSYTLELSKTPSFLDSVITIASNTTLLRRQGLHYSTKYYARVSTDVFHGYGKTTSFTTRTAEEDAFVSVPANGAVNVESIGLTVISNKVQNATIYTIELSKSPDFTGEVLTKSTIDAIRTVTFENLDYLTTFYARVKTDVSGYGITTHFKTRAEEIVYVIASEAPASGHDPKMITLTIDQMRGASSYILELSKQADFSNLIPIHKLSSDQFSFVFRDLDYSSQYYARAKSNISTDFGPAITFTTRAPFTEHRLWAMTQGGGAHGYGTLFSYSIDSAKFTKHYDLPAGNNIWSTLVQTPTGVMGMLGGQIFQYQYDGEVIMSAPKYRSGVIMLASDNHLYVSSPDTDTQRAMTYKILADEVGRDPQPIFTFPKRGSDAYFAYVETPDGYLFNTTYSRGLNGAGNIFRLKSDGSGYQSLHDFSTYDGWGARGVIDGKDGYVYGMTVAGSYSRGGVIFKCKTDGSDFAVLYTFTNYYGESPNGKLLKVGNVLYGTTFWGGSSGYYGVIFRINTDGSDYRKLKDMVPATGAFSVQGLTAGQDGMLYGMTGQGGLYGGGVMFQIRDDGTDFKVLLNFNNNTGYAPGGDFLFMEDVLRPLPPMVAARLTQENISFGPNPFQTSFGLEIKTADVESVRVIINDLQGNKLSDVMIGSNVPMPLGNDLMKGIYVLQVVTRGKVSTYRIVKN